MNSGEYSEANSSRSPNRLRAYAGLLQDVSILISELEANKAANQAEATFSFDLIGENEIMIPEAIQQLMPDMKQITVTIGKADTEHPSYLSINFISDNKTIVISRSGMEDNEQTPDVEIDTSLQHRVDFKPDGTPYVPTSVKEQLQQESTENFEKRRSDLERITRSELNALIMSLVHPDPDRLYAQFDDVDFLSPTVHDSIRDSFEISALNNQNTVNYEFNSSDTIFNFYKREGQPVSFGVTYFDEKSERQISAQSDLETDFRIEFSTQEALQENPYFPGENESVRTPYFPTTEEIYYLLTLLETEIGSINPSSITLMEDDLINSIDPEAQMLQKDTTILSKTYVKRILDQFRFDSPDSGTAWFFF